MSDYYELYQQCKLERDSQKEEIQRLKKLLTENEQWWQFKRTEGLIEHMKKLAGLEKENQELKKDLALSVLEKGYLKSSRLRPSEVKLISVEAFLEIRNLRELIRQARPWIYRDSKEAFPVNSSEINEVSDMEEWLEQTKNIEGVLE